MKTENNILEKIGNKNPYKVPENYFEDFADNMDKILDSMPLPEGMESVVEAPAATTETKPMVEAEAKEVSEDEIKQMKSLKADILEILPKIKGEDETEEALEQIAQQSFEDIFKAFYKKERGTEVEEEVLEVLLNLLGEEDEDETH